MLRAISSRIYTATNTAVRANIQRTCVAASVRYAHHVQETADQFDSRYEAAFNDPNTDGWMLRKLINDLHGYDLVPEPKIVIAALKACRRNNDFALAVRCLEAVRDKAGPKVGEIWPYMLEQIRPTLDELGISTPEELGYDKPELALQDVYDIH